MAPLSGRELKVLADPPDSRPPTAAEARAEVEARRAETALRRSAELDRAFGGELPGLWIERFSWGSTVVFVVLAAATALRPADLAGAFVAVCLVGFVLGSLLFVVDLVLAATRSREDLMGIGGLFFLAGAGPRRIVASLNLSLVVTSAAAVAAAAARPFTELAFGILFPILPLALSGLWGTRHGHFPPKPDPQEAPERPTGTPGRQP